MVCAITNRLRGHLHSAHLSTAFFLQLFCLLTARHRSSACPRLCPGQKVSTVPNLQSEETTTRWCRPCNKAVAIQLAV